MNRIFPLACVVAIGCGSPPVDANGDGIADGIQTPDTVSVVGPSRAVGTVSGIVTDTRFAPLDGAEVTLVLGLGGDAGTRAYTDLTDPAGVFTFAPVPAPATGTVVVTRPGYGTARTQVSVPGVAGNFPANDGNANVGTLLLTRLDGSVRFSVFSSTGKPAQNARGILSVTPAALQQLNPTTYGTGQGVVVAEATVDSAGVLSFTGVPSPAELSRLNGTYSLTIGAWDDDNDGVLESLGDSRTYSGTDLFTDPLRTIVLPTARVSASLAILSTNVESLLTTGSSSLPYRNRIAPSGSINMVFNQPVAQMTLLSVKVVQENCATDVPVRVEQRAPNVISISGMSPFASGTEYGIAIRATGLGSGATTSFVGTFWALDSTPRTPASTITVQARKAPGSPTATALQPGDELFVLFDTPVGNASSGRAFFNFDLDGSGGIGTADGGEPGELGSPLSSGFTVSLAEWTSDPSGTFTCEANLYGTRYRVNYGFLPPGGVPAGTPVRVVLPSDQIGTGGYQTGWAQPVTGNFSGTLSVLP